VGFLLGFNNKIKTAITQMKKLQKNNQNQLKNNQGDLRLPPPPLICRYKRSFLSILKEAENGKGSKETD
jgi:hypothetical protein